MDPSDLRKIEASVSEMLEVAEIQDQVLFDAAKAQMIKDCVKAITTGRFTMEEVLAQNEECCRNTRINKMRGSDLEGILKELATAEGIYEEKEM